MHTKRERERKRTTKRNTKRLRELKKGIREKMKTLMWAANNGHADTVRVLLEAGAAIEAKDNVSKRISICTCVCVCVRLLYSCIIVLFYSILLFYYCDM